MHECLYQLPAVRLAKLGREDGVDLDPGDGQRPQPRQRRRVRAEVADERAHAQLAQAVQVGGNHLLVSQQRVRWDLDLHLGRPDARLAEQVGEDLGKRGLHHVQGGDVHGDALRRARLAPPRGVLSERLAQHQLSERDGEADGRRNRHERTG